MYSSRKIRERLQKIAPVLGFYPEYHTIESVQKANDHFAELWDSEAKQWKRPLKPREIQWIRNERALCMCDARYWLTRYAWIKDWTNEIIRFAPNFAQQIFLDICGEMEDEEREILLQFLKARQLGISTLSELLTLHRILFYAGVNAIIGSNDPDKSWKMSQMMELCLKLQPSWMLPNGDKLFGCTKYKSGLLLEFGTQNSGVSIQHGAQMSGIGRGDTPTVFHLSELADFIDPASLVDSALLNAIHPSPYVFGVLESTASGIHNWWHNTWMSNKKQWLSGRGRVRPVFLPWFVGRDIWPTETWTRTHPIPPRWQPATITKNHAERAKNYVRLNPTLSKYLGKNWEMPREQMWWWEVTREDAKDRKELGKFLSEMPSDDNEAFQSANISVFDTELIAEYREAAKKQPVAVYGIVGPEIPERLHPEERDIDRAAIRDGSKPIIRVTWISENAKRAFEFVPLKFHGWDAIDPDGKLFIWETPRVGCEYGIGIDTGEGVGADSSSIEVIRNGNSFENDCQAAEYNSANVNASDLAPIALAIGAYYRVKDYDGQYRQPRMVVECMANGETTQLELKKMGWTNFHPRTRLDARRIQRNRSNTIGVKMTPWFRSNMMDHLMKYLRDGYVDINSPWFVNEMQELERADDDKKFKAMTGGHDDRILSLGSAMFSIHETQIMGSRRSDAQARAEAKHEGAPVWTPDPSECDMEGYESLQETYMPEEA